MCHAFYYSISMLLFSLGTLFFCVSTLLISSSVFTGQPRRCCRFLHKYRIRALWIDDDCRNMMSTYVKAATLFAKEWGIHGISISGTFWSFQNWPVEKTNFTDCLQIVYSWQSWWNSWWNSPDVKLLSNESYIFSHLHLFCQKPGLSPYLFAQLVTFSEPLGSLCQLDITFLQARAHLAASRNQEAA